MSYRDRLRKASFRGVEFQVSSSDYGGGRRSVVHEYPGREEPFTEDLGGHAEGFKIEAFVLGDDYDLDRDRLLLALSEPGPGELIHPYLGVKRVQVLGKYRVRESSVDGRMARFSITFVEAGQEQFPEASDNSAAVVRLALEVARERAKADAVKEIEVLATVPSFAKEAVGVAIEDILEVVESAPAEGGLEQAAEMARRIEDILDDVQGKIGAPESLVGELEAVVVGVWPEGEDAFSAYRSYLSIFDASATLLGGTSVAHQTADKASNSIAALVRTLAVASAAEAAVDVSWPTLEEAIVARDTLASQLDFESEDASDDLFLSLQDLRSEVVAGIPAESESLPRIQRVDIRDTTPSLVAAYEIHDDLGREGELLSRNPIRHPGFVPGGLSLEVLANG